MQVKLFSVKNYSKNFETVVNLREKIILLFAAVILIFSSNSVFAKASDYELVNQLVISEQMYRFSHRCDEHANCFFADATIRTSWQIGDVSSFVGQHPAENSDEIFNVNRCGSALIYLRKNRAFIEYPIQRFAQ